MQPMVKKMVKFEMAGPFGAYVEQCKNRYISKQLRL